MKNSFPCRPSPMRTPPSYSPHIPLAPPSYVGYDTISDIFFENSGDFFHANFKNKAVSKKIFLKFFLNFFSSLVVRQRTPLTLLFCTTRARYRSIVTFK